jgi:hypothetical protein
MVTITAVGGLPSSLISVTMTTNHFLPDAAAPGTMRPAGVVAPGDRLIGSMGQPLHVLTVEHHPSVIGQFNVRGQPQTPNH